MKVSRTQRAALGELKNLVGFIMDQEPTEARRGLVCALVLRMKHVIVSSDSPYPATDADIQEMLTTAAIIEVDRKSIV